MRLTRLLFHTLLQLMLLAIAIDTHAQVDSNPSEKYFKNPEDYKPYWDMELVSDYRSKGIDQTFGLPALQGGISMVFPDHFYIGNWNSLVSSGAGYPGTILETDLYAGWYEHINQYDINAGIYGAIYPGSNVANYIPSAIYPSLTSGMVHNGDLFASVKTGYFTIQENVSFTNLGNMVSPSGASTIGSSYTNLTGVFPIDTWKWAGGGLSLVTHAGYVNVNNYSAANYVDWKLGVTKQFTDLWSANLSYIQTNAKGNCSIASSTAQPYCFNKYMNANGTTSGPNKNAGAGTLLLTVKVANF